MILKKIITSVFQVERKIFKSFNISLNAVDLLDAYLKNYNE